VGCIWLFWRGWDGGGVLGVLSLFGGWGVLGVFRGGVRGVCFFLGGPCSLSPSLLGGGGFFFFGGVVGVGGVGVFLLSLGPRIVTTARRGNS